MALLLERTTRRTRCKTKTKRKGLKSMHPSDYLRLMLLDHTSSEGISNKVWEAWLKQQTAQNVSSDAIYLTCTSHVSNGNVYHWAPSCSSDKSFTSNMIHTIKDASSFLRSGQSSLQNDQVSPTVFPSVASTSSLSQGHATSASLPDQHNLSLTLQAKQDSHVATACNFPSTMTDFTAACRGFCENPHYDNAGSSSLPPSSQSSFRNNRVANAHFSNAHFSPLVSTVETYPILGINRCADLFPESSCDQKELNCDCQAKQDSDVAVKWNISFIPSDFTGACGNSSGIPVYDDATQGISRRISCPGSLNQGMSVSSSFPTGGQSSLHNNQVVNSTFRPVEFTVDDSYCDMHVDDSDADLLIYPASSRERITKYYVAAKGDFPATGANSTATCRNISGMSCYDDATRDISRHSSSPCNVIRGMRVSSSFPTDGHSSLVTNKVVNATFPPVGSTVDTFCYPTIHQGHEDLLPFRASSPDRSMMNAMCWFKPDSNFDATRVKSAYTKSGEIHSINEVCLTSEDSSAPWSPFLNGSYDGSKSPSGHTSMAYPGVFDGVKMLLDKDESKNYIPPPSHAENYHRFNQVCPRYLRRQPARAHLTAVGSEKPSPKCARKSSPKCARKSMPPVQKRKMARKKALTRSKRDAGLRSTSHYVITPSSATIVALSAEIRNEIASCSDVENLRCSASAGVDDDEFSNNNCENNEFSVLKLATTMEASQRSQQNIHEWDKKFGLRRAHSKTMRESARSRTKVLKFLKGEGANLIRGIPLMRMRNQEEATATDTGMDMLLSNEEDSIGCFSHDFSSHLDDQTSLADFEIFDLDGEDGELTKILQRALRE